MWALPHTESHIRFLKQSFSLSKSFHLFSFPISSSLPILLILSHPNSLSCMHAHSPCISLLSLVQEWGTGWMAQFCHALPRIRAQGRGWLPMLGMEVVFHVGSSTYIATGGTSCHFLLPAMQVFKKAAGGRAKGSIEAAAGMKLGRLHFFLVSFISS